MSTLHQYDARDNTEISYDCILIVEKLYLDDPHDKMFTISSSQ